MMKISLVSAVLLVAVTCGAAPPRATTRPAPRVTPKATPKKTTPKPAPKKPTPKVTPKPAPKPTPKTFSKPAPDLFDSSAPATPANAIDRIVFARLAELKIKPVLCSDSVFVRRAYLDVTGTLPTAKEAREFIQSPDKNKRIALIDRLMGRDEFADYWSMKWGDVLRIKAEFPINLWPNAAQAYHRWVRASIVENKPYDQFVREMLTSSGSNFRVGPVNFYRAMQNKTPEGIATAVALTFMGARTDSWPKDRLPGVAVFFSQIGYKPTSEWKEENVFWDPLGSSKVAGSIATGQAAINTSPPRPPAPKPETPPAKPKKPPVKTKKPPVKTKKPPVKPKATSSKPTAPAGQSTASPTKTKAPPAEPKAPPVKLVTPRAQMAVFPDGTKVKLSPNQDPREVFAAWLITKKNPWFARSAVNRVWAWVMGRGIVHEPDDIRDGNPPINPKLMAYLEKEFIASGYDMRKLFRLILTSNTYQLSSVARSKSPKAAANFANYPLRRLDAEVLIDAVNRITGTTDLYTSPIPEPFTYIPKDMRAVEIADGSITSSFLALFGRSARATGMENERDNKPVAAQWLHMLNSGHIQRKLELSGRLKAICSASRKPDQILEDLYLTVLSRFPTAQEAAAAEAYGKFAAASKPKIGKNGKPIKTRPSKYELLKRQNDWLDITWALINSPEFLYRH